MDVAEPASALIVPVAEIVLPMTSGHLYVSPAAIERAEMHILEADSVEPVSMMCTVAVMAPAVVFVSVMLVMTAFVFAGAV